MHLMSSKKDGAQPHSFIMMRKLFLCLALLVLTSSVRATVTGEEANNDSTLVSTTLVEKALPSLDKVMQAIIKVESDGNPKAFNKNGNCAGILQITPGLVKQCNIWLKEKKSPKRYTLQDRFDKKKSVEMFYMVQDHYNPKHDIERAIRIWNGGPGFSKKGTQGYYRKVMSKMK